jgi:hypothetical protein
MQQRTAANSAENGENPDRDVSKRGTSNEAGLWPDRPPAGTASMPLSYDNWAGPYRNEAGRRWVEKINEWYRDGSAAGLWQDTFRSFDNGHSSIRLDYYPQMKREEPVSAFGPSFSNVLPQRVTFGVQSFGAEGMSVIDYYTRKILRAYYETGRSNTEHPQPLHMAFYERNFLFVAPAVGSYGDKGDRFTFLSPYYLHSVGASGTDAKLLKPLVFAAAALPPELKTRILRKGLYVPTLMYLFKSAIAGGVTSPNAHVPAYSLPPEAEDDYTGPTPFIDSLINSAHVLTHIPPVCRFAIEPVYVKASGAHGYGANAFYEKTPYAFAGALRDGQEFKLEVDLRESWVDDGRSILDYHASLLRGPGTIERLNSEGSRMRIRVPWTVMDKDKDSRTDILLLVFDGAYYSAPAYISIRHIHRLDPLILGLKAK